MLLFSSDTTRRTLMHLFLFTNSAQRTGFNMYAEYKQPQLTFLALVPCHHPMRDESVFRGLTVNMEIFTSTETTVNRIWKV